MSPGISDEETRRAENSLMTRVVQDVVDFDGLLRFPSWSIYHRLPERLQTEVQRRARRNADALAEHG